MPGPARLSLWFTCSEWCSFGLHRKQRANHCRNNNLKAFNFSLRALSRNNSVEHRRKQRKRSHCSTSSLECLGLRFGHQVVSRLAVSGVEFRLLPDSLFSSFASVGTELSRLMNFQN